jgi:electron transfer flavoprotein-quinone oxidoreductase
LSTSQFQCIVVGAGFAGCAAAIRLAQKGIKTLLVERADEGGAKNLSGGILWGNDLAAILPDWKATMPVERPVSNKKVGFLSENGPAFVVDYHDPSLKTETVGYAVLRAKTDKWLVEQAKKAGVTVITGVNVEALHKTNGRVTGVWQGGEVTTADVVIVADGANSRLTLQGDLRHGDKKLDMDHYALGVKEVLKLPKGTLEDRFQVGADGGMAGEFVLGRRDGVLAGGFLYTNQDTLSLGVVINLRTMKNQGELTTHDVVEQFRNHPYIAQLTKGAELVEYGAHLVPEGGYVALSELYSDGVLVAGDAAGFCFSNGIVIQGMNYASARPTPSRTPSRRATSPPSPCPATRPSSRRTAPWATSAASRTSATSSGTPACSRSTPTSSPASSRASSRPTAPRRRCGNTCATP